MFDEWVQIYIYTKKERESMGKKAICNWTSKKRPEQT